MKPGHRSQKRGGAGRSTSRAVIAMAVMGGLVLLYGWNSFFLAPRGRAKAQAAKELAAAKTSEQDLRQSLAQLRKLADNSKSREVELVKLGTLIPTDSDIPGVILAFDATAKQAGVTMSSLVPAPAAAPTGAGAAAGASAGGPQTLSISVKVSGSFSQIFDYLRRLEMLDRLVVVDNIQLGGSASGNGPLKLEADIKARMFAAGTGKPATTTVAAASTAGGTKGTSTAADSSSPAALAKAGN